MKFKKLKVYIYCFSLLVQMSSFAAQGRSAVSDAVIHAETKPGPCAPEVEPVLDGENSTFLSRVGSYFSCRNANKVMERFKSNKNAEEFCEKINNDTGTLCLNESRSEEDATNYFNFLREKGWYLLSNSKGMEEDISELMELSRQKEALLADPFALYLYASNEKVNKDFNEIKKELDECSMENTIETIATNGAQMCQGSGDFFNKVKMGALCSLMHGCHGGGSPQERVNRALNHIKSTSMKSDAEFGFVLNDSLKFGSDGQARSKDELTNAMIRGAHELIEGYRANVVATLAQEGQEAPESIDIYQYVRRLSRISLKSDNEQYKELYKILTGQTSAPEGQALDHGIKLLFEQLKHTSGVSHADDFMKDKTLRAFFSNHEKAHETLLGYKKNLESRGSSVPMGKVVLNFKAAKVGEVLKSCRRRTKSLKESYCGKSLSNGVSVDDIIARKIEDLENLSPLRKGDSDKENKLGHFREFQFICMKKKHDDLIEKISSNPHNEEALQECLDFESQSADKVGTDAFNKVTGINCQSAHKENSEIAGDKENFMTRERSYKTVAVGGDQNKRVSIFKAVSSRFNAAADRRDNSKSRRTQGPQDNRGSQRGMGAHEASGTPQLNPLFGRSFMANGSGETQEGRDDNLEDQDLIDETAASKSFLDELQEMQDRIQSLEKDLAQEEKVEELAEAAGKDKSKSSKADDLRDEIKKLRDELAQAKAAAGNLAAKKEQEASIAGSGVVRSNPFATSGGSFSPARTPAQVSTSSSTGVAGGGLPVSSGGFSGASATVRAQESISLVTDTGFSPYQGAVVSNEVVSMSQDEIATKGYSTIKGYNIDAISEKLAEVKEVIVDTKEGKLLCEKSRKENVRNTKDMDQGVKCKRLDIISENINPTQLKGPKDINDNNDRKKSRHKHLEAILDGQSNE